VFIITAINVLGYIVIALVHLPTHFGFTWKLLIDVLSYLAYQGAYSHVMVIYAFCNVDNVSWGTKGNKGQRVSRYLIEKVIFIANWYELFFILGCSIMLYLPLSFYMWTSLCREKLRKGSC
jgi:chitin synthase